MKTFAVYCGASSGNKPIFASKTHEFAQWLVKNKHRVVYGGGKNGLMGILANTILDKGGDIIGIVPENLAQHHTQLMRLKDLRVVANMAVRKEQMLTLADVCLALPGGPGTLEEIADAFSWTRVGNNDNPCIFLNIDGYYDPLKQMFDDMVTNNFLSEDDRNHLLFTTSFTEINDFIMSYTPPIFDVR